MNEREILLNNFIKLWAEQKKKRGTVPHEIWNTSARIFDALVKRGEFVINIVPQLSKVSGYSVEDFQQHIKEARARIAKEPKPKKLKKTKAQSKSQPKAQPKKTITIMLNGVPISGDAETITLILNQLGAV